MIIEGTSLIETDIASRRSGRVHRMPSHLKDFHCNLINSSTAQHSYLPFYFGNYISFQGFGLSHRQFVLNVASEYEPSFYHQAVRFLHWCSAMTNELEAMERNNTWTVVPLPTGVITLLVASGFIELNISQMAQLIAIRRVSWQRDIINKKGLII